MHAIADWVVRSHRRVLAWFGDDVFRRLFVNAGKLLSANAVAAVLGLVATVLTARTLGPEKYGVLALVLVYELTVGRLVTFNAWQAIIKYGSEALHADDRPALRQLIKFGFVLDVVSAVVGTVVAMALAGPVIRLLGWDRSVHSLLVLYSVVILFSLSGTPIGILRLFDRFDLLSYTTILSALVRLAGVGWCLLTRQSLFGFVLVYLVTGIAGQLYQVLVSLWVLRRQEMNGVFKQSLRGIGERFPGVWDYVWSTYLNSTVVMTLREGSSLVIAVLTSPAAFGLYKIAQQVSRVLPMLSDPLYHTTYPELARLWSTKNTRAFFSLIRRTAILVGTLAMSVWLFFVLTGQWIIQKTTGPAYGGAYLLAVLYMLAYVIALCGVCLQPAMLAMGLPRKSLVAISIGTVFYFILLFSLIWNVGVLGACIAYIGYYVVWFAIMALYLRPYWVASRLAGR